MSSYEYNSEAEVEVGDNMYVVEKILKKVHYILFRGP